MGNAHRWAHPMLNWTANIGVHNNHPLHIQVMMMPYSALERIRRVLPSLVEITWSARSSNPHLFNCERMEWTVPHKRILGSLDREVAFRKLRNGFGYWKERNHINLSKNEARLIDNTVARLYLSYLETSRGTEFLGTSEEQTSEFLTQMKEKNALQLFYEFNETGLPRPLVTVAQGSTKQIISLTHAMLRNTPSSVALLAKGNKTVFIISSVPVSTRVRLSQELPVLGKDRGMNIRCMVPQSFRNYSGDLFQKLLKPDGTWFDNVSGIVTQARAALRALPDEIAREVLEDDLELSSVLIDSRVRTTRSEIDA